MSARLRFLGIALAVGLALSSCTTIGGQPRYPFHSAQQIDERLKAWDKAVVDSCMASGADLCRNQIITSRIDVVNDVYRVFKGTVSTASGAVDISGDLLSALASGASTVVGGTQAKNILSGIATVITGGKASIDKNLFLQQSAHVLLGRMDALRAAVLGRIQANLLRPASQYPLWWAIRDVDNYIEAGSFGAAITDIETTSGTAKTQANSAAQGELKFRFGPDDNSKVLRKFWKPDGVTINTGNQTLLQNEMITLAADPVTKVAIPKNDIETFLIDPDFAAARASAVKDLKLNP